MVRRKETVMADGEQRPITTTVTAAAVQGAAAAREAPAAGLALAEPGA